MFGSLHIDLFLTLVFYTGILVYVFQLSLKLVDIFLRNSIEASVSESNISPPLLNHIDSVNKFINHLLNAR